jgi:hypothetical protein
VSGSRKISELTSATVLTGDEIFPIVQEGETRQANVRALDIFQAVRSVNGIGGDVIIALNDLPGVEQIVIDAGVSAAIGSVSVRVDDTSAAITSVQTYLLSEISVRVEAVSAAITSVQTYLLNEISVLTAGGLTDAPNDGSVYARQSGSWQIVPVTAIQSQIDAVSVLASVNAAKSYADLALACSDETTAITTGTAIQFSIARGVSLSDVVFECNVAPTSTTCELEVRVSSSVLHAGYILMDPGKTTSRTAATTTSLIKTSVGSWRRAFVSVRSTDATFAGLKLYLLGRPL